MGDNLAMVRLAKSASDKLAVIAKAKKLTKSEALSRIISHYCQNKIDFNVASEDVVKSIFAELKMNRSVYFEPTSATLTRIEAFIRSLLKGAESRLDTQDISDDEQSESPENNKINAQIIQTESLDLKRILDVFFEDSRKMIVPKVGNSKMVVQIRFAQEELEELKKKYDEICMLLNS